MHITTKTKLSELGRVFCCSMYVQLNVQDGIKSLCLVHHKLEDNVIFQDQVRRSEWPPTQ